jgi:hypothetical protein
MKAHALLSVSVAMAIATSLADGQSRPNFSGRWTVAAAAAPEGGRGGGPRADMGSGWGTTITLTQSDSVLSLEWVIFSRGDLQPPLTFVYPLDGSERTNAFMMGRGLEKQVSRCAWNGASLVITTTQAFPNLVAGRSVESVVKRTLTLESPSSLVVETTRSAALGGQPSTTRPVYTKG